MPASWTGRSPPPPSSPCRGDEGGVSLAEGTDRTYETHRSIGPIDAPFILVAGAFPMNRRQFLAAAPRSSRAGVRRDAKSPA